MSLINLNQKLQRIKFNEFEMDNQIVFNFFDKLPKENRDDTLFRSIYIGVLALMEDRFSAFLAKTQNELGTELESLKMIFDMKKDLFYTSTIKGLIAEDEIVEFLNNYFIDKKLKDRAHQTGNLAGSIPKNKTGDIVCLIDGDEDKKIVIECKFDKSIRLGDIESKDSFARKSDTAWSQLLEAKVNRSSKVSIIVFDLALVDNSVLNSVESVLFIPEVGFAVIVNSQKGDYSNLLVAYRLARDIAVNSNVVEYDPKILSILVRRIIKDIESHQNIKSLILRNIETNREILRQLDKSMLSMQFNEKYLRKFLIDGTLDSKDLFDFYMSDEIRSEFNRIEPSIRDLFTENVINND